MLGVPSRAPQVGPNFASGSSRQVPGAVVGNVHVHVTRDRRILPQAGQFTMVGTESKQAGRGAHFGIETRRGLLSERSVTPLYVALRISELLKGVHRPRICEIGGGTGYVACWCDQIGLTKYTSSIRQLLAQSGHIFWHRTSAASASSHQESRRITYLTKPDIFAIFSEYFLETIRQAVKNRDLLALTADSHQDSPTVQ
jgi:hypothetical protein